MVQIKLPYGTAHTPITISNDRPNNKNTTPAASMALGVPDLLSIVSFGLYSIFFLFLFVSYLFEASEAKGPAHLHNFQYD